MKRTFCTIINSLKSPQNVGMIVRSHVAFGGSELIITGHKLPWQFKKGTEAFSRKLEKQCVIKHIPDQFETLQWCKDNNYTSIALEIASPPVFIDEFTFPERVALIVGSESTGLDKDFLAHCDHILTVRQIGNVGSLNVAVAASTTMHEFNRHETQYKKILGNKYEEEKIIKE